MSEFMLKFAGSLFFTLLSELPVSFLFKARNKDILLVLLVNILTNPLVVLISMLAGNRVFVQVLLEIAVVFAEGGYYIKCSTYIKRGFFCSLCCNLVSYSLGLFLNH